MTYDFRLYDGSALASVNSLESDGVGARSVPRQVVDLIFNNVEFSPARDSFLIADDLTARFTPGLSFFIPEGPFAGDYVVSPGGSTYDPLLRRTTVSVVGTITAAPLQIVGVVTGASGVWKVQGAANGSSIYYPTSAFTVVGNGAGDGTYTVISAETSGTYPVVGVNVVGGIWSLAGDHTNFFSVGTPFKVSGSTPGAGSYTVASATLNGTNTDVVVVEVIPTGATSSGSATPWPPVTRVSVVEPVPGASGSGGTASIPPSLTYTFAAPPTMLTLTGPNTYSIIWNVTGDVTPILIPGSVFSVRSNDVFNHQLMTVVSASFAAGVTGVNATFRTDVAISTLPDGTGYITYPLPAVPYGHIQYDIVPASTSLMLIGRGSPSFNDTITWGQALQENDIHLAEHFRTSDGIPPAAPLTGQLWYDEMNTAMQLFASVKYAVVDVTTGASGSWHIGGDHTAVPALQAGKQIVVYNDSGSGPESEKYTVASLAFVGANTIIQVVEPVPATAVGDGTLYSLDDWHGVIAAGLPAAGNVDMNGHTICGVGVTGSPAAEFPLTTISDTCAITPAFADVRYVSSTNPAGDAMAGPLNMSNNRITTIAAPVAAQDAVNLQYADTNYVNVAGDTMTGNLNMSNSRIISLGSPTTSTDAVNKAYVDSLTSGVVWIQGVLDPNLFDDTLSGPDVGTAADPADPLTPLNRAFIVRPLGRSIVGSLTGPNRWVIAGNEAVDFAPGDTFTISGNGAADGTYTLLAAADVGSDTELTVATFLGVPTTSGFAYHAHGDWNGLDGHVVTYDPVALEWVSVLTTTSNVPRPVQAGDRFGVFMLPDNDDPLTVLPGGSLMGHAGEILTVQSVVPYDYEIVWTTAYTPLEPDAVSVIGTHSPHFGHSYTFRGTWGVGGFNVGYKWIQFAGPAMIVDGSGLRYSGNILNVVNGDGLTFSGDQLVTDDTFLRTVYLKLDGTGSSLSANLDLNGNAVTNVADPINPQDAVTLQFADTNYVNVGGDTMTGALTLAGAPTVALHAATKQYVDDADALKLNLAGGTLTGPLTLPADPTNNLEAATKQYVDAAAGGSGAAEPIDQIVYGTGAGVTSSSAFKWDSTTNTAHIGSSVTPGRVSSGVATVNDGINLTVTTSDAAGPNNIAGTLTIQPGTSTGNGYGANAAVYGGVAGPTGAGGAVGLVAGSGGSTSGNGGAVTIAGGSAPDGYGGNISIVAGTGAGLNHFGGRIALLPGGSADPTQGGDVYVTLPSGITSFRAYASANVQLGSPQVLTTSTDGFPYIPTVTGVPTGVPTAITGYAPMVVNSASNRLYIYVAGAWRYTALI